MIKADFLVYLVEDDQDFLKSAAALVRSAGYAVETYTAGTDFLDEVSEEIPACLVTDYRLGGLTGLEIQQHLNENGIEIPIIFVSGHAGVDVAVEAMRHGAITLLEKPFTPSRLLTAIEEARTVIEQRQSEQAELEQARTRLATLTNKGKRSIWACCVSV